MISFIMHVPSDVNLLGVYKFWCKYHNVLFANLYLLLWLVWDISVQRASSRISKVNSKPESAVQESGI